MITSKQYEGMFSSKSDEWETPQKTFDELNKEFRFDLDPCADESNHKCEKYFTKEQDGLLQDWGVQRILQSPIRQRTVEMGYEIILGKSEAGYSCSHVNPGKDRYKMVPRLHLRQSRNQIYQRTAAL